MFSRFTNAQNRVGTIPITAVTWSIPSNTTSTYNALAQSVTVVSVSPPGATYTTSTTFATNAGGVAQTTLTGSGIYTGSFTSPTLTITAKTITVTSSYPADPIDPSICIISDIAGFTISINGMVGGTVPVSILFNNVLCAVEAGNVNEGRVSSTGGTSPYQNVQVSGGNFTFYTTYNNPPNYYQVTVNNASYSGSTNNNYSVANLGRNVTNSCGT